MTKQQRRVFMTFVQVISIICWLMMDKTITGGRGWWFFYGFLTYNCIGNIWTCIFPPEED